MTIGKVIMFVGEFRFQSSSVVDFKVKVKVRKNQTFGGQLEYRSYDDTADLVLLIINVVVSIICWVLLQTNTYLQSKTKRNGKKYIHFSLLLSLRYSAE